jgi:glutamine synthetase
VRRRVAGSASAVTRAEVCSPSRQILGIRPLPQDLDQAIRVMQDSELVAETLGEHVFDFFLRNKREEWHEYRRQVTEYEPSRYLPML